MRLYRIGSTWVRTQDECRQVLRNERRKGRPADHAVEVPTDHAGLCAFLNGLSLPAAAAAPVGIVTLAMTEEEARAEVRDWTLARARFRVPTTPEPTLLQRAELVRRYRAESAEIFNGEE